MLNTKQFNFDVLANKWNNNEIKSPEDFLDIILEKWEVEAGIIHKEIEYTYYTTKNVLFGSAEAYRTAHSGSVERECTGYHQLDFDDFDELEEEYIKEDWMAEFSESFSGEETKESIEEKYNASLEIFEYGYKRWEKDKLEKLEEEAYEMG